MIAELEICAEPDWLSRINAKTIEDVLPISDLLDGSLYYPACGIDGDPIAYLAGNFLSFIYVDYSISLEELSREVRNRGFVGYRILAQRSVSEKELVPDGWALPQLAPQDGKPNRNRDLIAKPYCQWFVFQRDDDRPPGHGPRRFSLLYLCADGVAAFHALYVSNRKSPAAVAIIQSGSTGSGGNWTDFTDPQLIFARSVAENCFGKPAVLLFGGGGGRGYYENPCWPDYSDGLGFLGNTSIGVWRRPGNRR